MLKVRLMGTKNDIAWFQKILQRHPKIEVMDEYYGAAEPPVRCGESHLSGLTEPP